MPLRTLRLRARLLLPIGKTLSSAIHATAKQSFLGIGDCLYPIGVLPPNCGLWVRCEPGRWDPLSSAGGSAARQPDSPLVHSTAQVRYFGGDEGCYAQTKVTPPHQLSRSFRGGARKRGWRRQEYVPMHPMRARPLNELLTSERSTQAISSGGSNGPLTPLIISPCHCHAVPRVADPEVKHAEHDVGDHGWTLCD